MELKNCFASAAESFSLIKKTRDITEKIAKLC